MRSKSTLSISFWINTSQINKEGKAKIFARVTVSGKRVNISLKYDIKTDQWDSYFSRVKGKSMKAREINKYLDSVRSELFQCYQELRLTNSEISAHNIKILYFGEEDKGKTLKELFDYHNVNENHSLNLATISHYKTTQKYLNSYVLEKFQATDYFLKDLDHRFLVEFDTYLRSIQPKRKQGKMSTNGSMKHIQRFRKMIGMAVQNDWLKKSPFAKFKVKMTKKEREFLTANELESLCKFNTVIERLQIVADLFIFSCYTGIAYGDIINLREDQIGIGIDQNKWIYTKRNKTKTSVRLPLLVPAIQIIEKYKEHPRREEGKLLPKISNQKANSYLKEIADQCGITKNLTFHMARHTFATTITLSNGVPIETVSKVLGHKRLATTQIYARVLDTKISIDMNKLQKKLKI